MGPCESRKYRSGPSYRKQSVIEPQPHSNNQREFGVYKTGSTLTFRHAPLNNSEFLMEKFYYDNRRPEEINLMWQITRVQVAERQIVVQVLAQKSVNIWLVLGG